MTDFPRSGVIFFVVDQVLTWEILGGISFIKWDDEEGLDTVSRLCASVSILMGK